MEPTFSQAPFVSSCTPSLFSQVTSRHPLDYTNVIYAIWLGCLSSCLPARLKVPFYAKPSLFHLERAHHMRQALISPPSVERVLLYLPCCGHRQNEHHALSLIHPAFLESCLHPSSRITWITIRVPPCLGWCGIRHSARGADAMVCSVVARRDAWR